MKKKILICLLLAALLFSLPAGMQAAAAENPFDMSDAVCYEPYTLTPAELLAEILGTDISQAEAAYLDAHSDFYFRLHDAIPADRVTTLPSEAGLTVRAVPYRYTAKSGYEVVWFPREAILGARRVSFTETADGAYECFLSGVSEADGTDLTVSYDTEVILPDQAVNTLLNLAYPEGYAAYEKILAYREAHTKYTADLLAHEEYLKANAAYKADYAAYLAYKTSKELYDTASANYAVYLEKKAAYDEAYAAYTAYQTDYANYLSAYDAYTKALSELLADRITVEAYLAYTAQVTAVSARLAPMNYIMDSVGYLYKTLMGDTVATVVNNKNLLVAAGCNASDIDTCATATNTLRRLLPLYEACESDAERYAFYREHHAEVLDAFTRLQKSLYGLFGNSLVQAELDNKQRLERFVQFVGQLYIARCLLDDTLSMSEDWTISVILAHKRRTYSLEEALNGITALPADSNTNSPKDTPWPTAPNLALPEDTEMPTEPTEPEEVARPIEPERVSHPGEEPTAVEEPTAPTEAAHPGEEPLLTVTDPYLLALADAIEAGELTERSEMTGKKITRHTVLHKYIAYDGLPVVTFYDYDGKTVLGRSVPDADGSATYRGPHPTREATKQNEFLFDGWVDGYGKTADLSSVTEDMAVYASYKTDALHYTVTWSVDGKQYTSRHVYGEIPVCPADTAKASTAQYDYQFAGWNTLIMPVTGDAAYTATYTEKLRSYTVTFVMQDARSEEVVLAGDTPTPPTPAPYLLTDDGYLMTFVRWNEEMSPVLTNKTYTALYSRTLLVQDRTTGGAGQVEVGDGLYTVTATRDMNIARLLMIASLEDAAVRLVADGVVLHMPTATVKELHAAGCAIVKLRVLNPHMAGVVRRASVSFCNSSAVQMDELPDGISLRFAYPTEKIECGEIYAEQDGDFHLCPTSGLDGYLFATVQNGTYALIERFTVRIEKSEFGAIASDRYEAAEGEKVTLTVLPDGGCRIVSLTVLRNDTGEELKLKNNSFTMPNASVTVYAEFEEIFYTVRFESEGVLIAEMHLRPGESLTVPPSPKHSEDDKYVFAAWSPAVQEIVTADAVYTASFHERPTENDYISENDNNMLFSTYLPIGGGVFGGIVVLVIILLVLRRKKKNRKDA